MKKIIHFLLFLIPLLLLVALTIVLAVNFDKLLINDIGKQKKYDILENKKEVVFKDRVEKINNVYIDTGAFIDVVKKMQSQTYHEPIYDKLHAFTIENQFINSKKLQDERVLKITKYNDIVMFDVHMRENLKIVQMAYTEDEQNLYYLYTDYNKRNDEVDSDAINSEELIEQAKDFLLQTNIMSLAKFFPTKVFLSESDKMYMLEDEQNDIIVCYDLIEKRFVGFVKGFSS